MMRFIVIFMFVLSFSVTANEPGVLKLSNEYKAQMRFKNGLVTTTTLTASSYQAAVQIAQSTCGGPANCTVIVYKN